MGYVAQADEIAGTDWACRALGVSRSTLYRRRRPPPPTAGPPAPRLPPWTLTGAEREEVLDVLYSDRFCEAAPAQVWATLLDEGRWLCSTRTMYRILADADAVRERRRQATHPARKKPHLHATDPNQVWSWDISKLPGPVKGVFYDLYEVLDIYSRKVVGWRVELDESGDWAADMFERAVATEEADPTKLTIHADNGPSMTGDDLDRLFRKLELARSHSRPRVSNDNPYSEASFRTMKYCPAWPGRFDSVDDARAWAAAFFDHYNNRHYHSGIGHYTPASVHDGTAVEIRRRRQATLDAAYQTNPERFRKRPPTAPRLPAEAWINETHEEIQNN